MPIPRWGEEELNNVNTAVKTGKLSEYFRNPLGGPWVQAFEQDLAKYHGVPYAVACSNGTSALHMALEAVMARMGRGNESKYDALQTAVNLRSMPLHDRWRYVVTTPYSFIATASSILMAGAEPWFIDIDPETYVIPSRESRGRRIPRECRIILPVHLLGHPCLTKDTLIPLSSDGLFTLGLTDGRVIPSRILDGSVREYTGFVYEIEFSDGLILEATPDHPILTITTKECKYKYGNTDWIPAKDLVKGNILYTLTTRRWRGISEDAREDVDGFRGRTIEEVVSNCQKKTGYNGEATEIHLEADKIQDSRVTSKVNQRVKSQFNTESKGRYPLQIINRFPERLLSWTDRWGRIGLNTFKKILLLAPSRFCLQYQPKNNRFPSSVWIDSLCNTQEANYIPQWKDSEPSETVLLSSMDRIQNNRNIKSNSTISIGETGTGEISHGVLRESNGGLLKKSVFSERERNSLACEGFEYKEIKNIRRTKRSIPVFNIRTSTDDYFANGILVHNCDMDWIKESGTWDYIIEDNAQGLGALYKGELCGTLGDISTCSFQFTKTITTMGEGGAVLTKDPDLYQRLIQLRSHGSQYSDSPFLTYNFRLTEPQAAFGVAQLSKLEGFLTVQRQNAMYILDHLPRGLKPPKISKDVEHSFFLIPTIFDEVDAGMTREEFLKRCTDAGVNQSLPGASVSAGYLKPLYEKPLLHRFRPVDGCPNVEEVMRQSVWLDIHRWRTLEEVKEDVEKMTAILEG